MSPMEKLTNGCSKNTGYLHTFYIMVCRHKQAVCLKPSISQSWSLLALNFIGLVMTLITDMQIQTHSCILRAKRRSSQGCIIVWSLLKLHDHSEFVHLERIIQRDALHLKACLTWSWPCTHKLLWRLASHNPDLARTDKQSLNSPPWTRKFPISCWRIYLMEDMHIVNFRWNIKLWHIKAITKRG